MNPLIDGVPHSIKVGDAEYKINTDFRTSLLVEEAIRDVWESSVDLITEILLLYLGPDVRLIGLDEIHEAIDELMSFYLCGAKPKSEKNEDEGDGAKESPVLSFQHDAEYIFAAFWQCYRIDLYEDELHWWKFNALLKSLPEGTMMSKIIGFRSEKITSKMPKEHKEYLQKMKRKFRLPLEQKEQEKLDAITEALMSGKGIVEALQ